MLFTYVYPKGGQESSLNNHQKQNFVQQGVTNGSELFLVILDMSFSEGSISKQPKFEINLSWTSGCVKFSELDLLELVLKLDIFYSILYLKPFLLDRVHHDFDVMLRKKLLSAIKLQHSHSLLHNPGSDMHTWVLESPDIRGVFLHSSDYLLH